jgi:hypothetical protein
LRSASAPRRPNARRTGAARPARSASSASSGPVSSARRYAAAG